MARGRLEYLDALRLALTALVVVHHALITYGASGSWFYTEPNDWTGWSTAASVITALNQLYFMGLFFLVAGYFTPGALARKGTGRFLLDRAIRLGIPLVLAFVFACPYLEVMKSAYVKGQPTDGYWHELAWRLRDNELSPGPLWFVEALLGFSLIYAVVRRVPKPRAIGHRELAILAAAIATTTFAIRVWWPAGQEWQHLQLAFFGQYGVLFAAGVWCAQSDAFTTLDARLAKVWGPVGLVAFFGIAVIANVSGGIPDALPLITGGTHWQAAAAAALESVYCVGAIVTMLVVFRDRVGAGRLTRVFAADAYMVYAIHAPVLVTICVGLRGWDAPPPVKMIVAAGATIAVCFAIAHALRRIALVRRVL